MDKDDKWLRVRSITQGWMIINKLSISEIHSIGTRGGFSLRMNSGSLVLMTHAEGKRVLNKILPKKLRP